MLLTIKMAQLTRSFWAAIVLTVALFICGSLTLVIADDTAPKEHIVEIRNLEFTPKELAVAPGDTVTWINYDFVPHTVTADNKSWDSGLIKKDGQWQIVVEEDMFTTYFCQYHPTMKAGIRIQQ